MMLAKIPLLFASILAVHVSLTPPQAPALSSEKVPSKTLREAFIGTHIWSLKVAKVCSSLTNSHLALIDLGKSRRLSGGVLALQK
jgi:hypothetical protein